MKLFYVSIASVCVLFLLFVSLKTNAQGVGSSSILIDARVAGCGDMQIEFGEDCDGTNLNGKSCTTQGFGSGTLSCTASCLFNTSQCVASSGGGGTGGGGSSSSGTKGAQVVLQGRAYPKSTITILKDAQIVATTIADNDARFQVNIAGLSAGSYIFSVYSEDTKGLRSSLLTFPAVVTKNVLTKFDNIFIAPTIATDKSEVKKGDPIVVFGQSIPASEITLEINSEEQIFVKTPSDTAGVYVHTFDTSVLELGSHHARSRATFASAISSQSVSVGFVVGTKNVFAVAPTTCPTKADFNKDCRVNLVDFSIAAFWYNRTLSPEFLIREKAHVNGDGKINLVDFSIMAFYWTG
jgi:hypothetical protein